MCSRAAGISASMCSCSVGSARGVTETHLKASLAGRVWAVEMGAPSRSRGEPVGWRHRVCSAGRCLSGPCRAGLCRGCRQHCWEEQPWIQEWLSPAVSAALWSWPPTASLWPGPGCGCCELKPAVGVFMGRFLPWAELLLCAKGWSWERVRESGPCWVSPSTPAGPAGLSWQGLEAPSPSTCPFCWQWGERSRQ